MVEAGKMEIKMLVLKKKRQRENERLQNTKAPASERKKGSAEGI